MSRTTLVIAGLAALVATGCGGDSTGPGNTNTNTPQTNLNGAWSYSTSNLTNGSLTCNSSGTVLTISRQGSTFSGSYAGGTLSCTTPTGTMSGAVGNGSVLNGSISGSAVGFDLDTSDWHNSGSISGNSMSGSLTVRLVLSGTTYILNGTWGAAHQ